VPKYYHEKNMFKIIWKDEMEVMLRHCKTLRDKVLLALVWLTGARISEVLALKRYDFDIDYEKDELRVRLITLKKRTKEPPRRELYFSIEKDPFVKDIIIPYIEKLDLEKSLFNIGKRRAQQILHEINKKTGFWYTFHEFRHSRLSYLARVQEASVSDLMDWTYWKDINMIGVYIIRKAPKKFKGKIR